MSASGGFDPIGRGHERVGMGLELPGNITDVPELAAVLAGRRRVAFRLAPNLRDGLNERLGVICERRKRPRDGRELVGSVLEGRFKFMVHASTLSAVTS